VEAVHSRPIARGLRAFLYVAVALTFLAGAKADVLSDETARFFAWAIAPPMSAVFIGASFWAACVLLLFAARQRLWVRARLAVPSVAVVATLLLAATLMHLDRFHGLIGVLWIHVYVWVPPVAAVLVVQQLTVPGVDPRPALPLPRALRVALALHALVLLVVGALLFADTDLASSIWPWALSSVTAKAIGTWLMGIGTVAAYVTARDDRADMPAPSLSYLVLPALLLLGIARYPEDLEQGSASFAAYVAFVASAAAIGAYGALLSFRDGGYRPVLPHGGVPVELKGGTAGSSLGGG
jgi:hypothetical protein